MLLGVHNILNIIEDLDMAKVTGPLFSQTASGQFGKSLVFGRRKGQNVVRGYVIPANPRTAAQVTNRIAFAVAGIVIRRLHAGSWGAVGEAQDYIQYWTSQATGANVWNSELQSSMLGAGNADYIAETATYAGLTDGNRTAWDTAAAIGGTDLPGYTRGSVTVTGGFMLFLVQRTNSKAGYETLADNTTPNPISLI